MDKSVTVQLLKSVGIEKGKPFKPDGKTQDVLKSAVGEAHQWLDSRFETAFTPYFEGRRWAIPASSEFVETDPTFWEKPGAFALDVRGLYCTYAFSSVKHLGPGQFYLIAIRDKAGDPFDGGGNYRVTVPPNPPAKQYWSVVLYDRATHALIRDVSRASRSSQSLDLKKNADGSVDVYFGPKAPEGKESNWVPTKAGGRFWVAFRFYGPEKPLFDKTWTLPDVEKVK